MIAVQAPDVCSPLQVSMALRRTAAGNTADLAFAHAGERRELGHLRVVTCDLFGRSSRHVGPYWALERVFNKMGNSVKSEAARAPEISQ